MSNEIVIFHRDELEEIIHDSVMKALREFKAEEETGVESEYYTRKEVAAKWHVDEVTVWRREVMKEIHPIRIGRRVLYRKEEIDNYNYKIITRRSDKNKKFRLASGL